MKKQEIQILLDEFTDEQDIEFGLISPSDEKYLTRSVQNRGSGVIPEKPMLIIEFWGTGDRIPTKTNTRIPMIFMKVSCDQR